MYSLRREILVRLVLVSRGSYRFRAYEMSNVHHPCRVSILPLTIIADKIENILQVFLNEIEECQAEMKISVN